LEEKKAESDKEYISLNLNTFQILFLEGKKHYKYIDYENLTRKRNIKENIIFKTFRKIQI